ncbi:MAG: hypothetical protein ACFFCE_18020 [Promethearchaeota archaeon]
MSLRKFIRKLCSKTRDFFRDEFGGNIIEYALLVGFALFIFFIIISVITSMLDWTVGLSEDFFDIFK